MRIIKLDEMAFRRSEAKKKIEGLAEPIMEHILKIGIYKDSTQDLRHWVEDEICEYLSIANDIIIKHNNGKFDRNFYKEHLFGSIGDSIDDIKVNVRLFQIQNRETQKYPEFKITQRVLEDTFKVNNIVQDYALSFLSTKNNLNKESISNVLFNKIKEIM